MNDCIVKQYGCSCAPGECAQPKPLPPHHSFDARFHLSACIVIGAIAGFIAFVALPRAIEASHKQILISQENVSHGKRN